MLIEGEKIDNVFKNNNLFIVESPFQLLSAIEANAYFMSTSTLIIKYNGNKINELQLKNIIDKYSNFDEVIEVFPIVSNFDANIKLFMILNKMIEDNVFFEKIFIGDYRSYHMRKFFDALNPVECYLLDDGNIIIDIVKYIELKEDQYYFNGLKGTLKKFIYHIQLLLFGLDQYTIRSDISLFTCFELQFNANIKYTKNNFDYIRSLTKSKTIKDVVYFYGSNLKILNITNDLEMQYLKYVSDYYRKQNLDIIYIPHRNETEEKILTIVKQLAIKIKKNDFPAEIQLVLDTEVPRHIASFVSSVLVSLPVIHSFDSVVSFQFPVDCVPEKNKTELIAVMKDYEKHMTVVKI